jgi:hypothetical protein
MLQGSYIYAKSCGGPQIASVTKVGVAELAVAVALFAEVGGHKFGPALKSLDVTQKAALTEAKRLIKANKKVVDRLKSNPKQLAVEEFELAEPGDFIGNVFRKLSSKPPLPGADGFADIDPNMAIEDVESLFIDMPPSSQAGRALGSSPSNGKSDELKNLVAEALNESRA